MSEAYRVLAQIFHPDRFVGSPERIKEEAQRRMQDLNEAYAQACNGGSRGAPDRGRRRSTPWRTTSTAPPRPGGPAMDTRAANLGWESAARYRAAMAVRHREQREAEERALPSGQAVAKLKTTFRPSMLLGLGLARETNRLRCKGCNSIQLLPPGWRDRLSSVDYHCCYCDRRILAR